MTKRKPGARRGAPIRSGISRYPVLGIRLPPELAAELKAVAESEEVTVTQLVGRLAVAYLAKHRKKHGKNSDFGKK